MLNPDEIYMSLDYVPIVGYVSPVSSTGVRFMTVNLMGEAAGPAGGKTYAVIGCARWSLGHYGPSR